MGLERASDIASTLGSWMEMFIKRLNMEAYSRGGNFGDADSANSSGRLSSVVDSFRREKRWEDDGERNRGRRFGDQSTGNLTCILVTELELRTRYSYARDGCPGSLMSPLSYCSLPKPSSPSSLILS